MTIEKRPIDNQENYLVLDTGSKKIEMPMTSVKATLFLWVFFATVFLTFVVGQYTVYQAQAMNIYLMNGNLHTDKGEPIACVPYVENRDLRWNCTVDDVGNMTVD